MTTHLKTVALSLFIVTSCFSQDLIIKRDSSRVFCKIIREDSLTLYYIPVRDRQQTEVSINKADVIKYFTAQSVAKEERERKAEAERKYREKEKIYETKLLNVGFYRSFREYFTNSPSITRKFTVLERESASLALSGGNPYTFVADSVMHEGNVRGFCDGKDVYYRYDFGGFCKMEYMGIYSFFSTVVHGSGLAATMPKQLMILDDQGTFNTASPSHLKKLLMSKNPELAAQYKAEENQRDKVREYLIKLNEYLMSKK